MERMARVTQYSTDPRALGRAASMCLRKASLWLCWVLRKGSRLYQLVGCAAVSPMGCWVILFEAGLLGTPGLHPHQTPPSGFPIFVIMKPLDLS